jgi:LysM repeat protein
MNPRACRSSLALALTLMALFAPLARARIIIHTVRPGDTLELLAAEYYGNRQNAVYIMAANNMTHARALRQGKPLKIPTAWKYKLKKGETLEHVAELYLGDKRRGPFLAEFSGYATAEGVRPGQDLVIPLHLTHQAQAPETLGMVAAALLGDSKKGELLRRYNFRAGTQLAKGERIVVPITHVRVREAKLKKIPDVAADEIAARKATSARVAASIEDAQRLYRDGQFAEVAARLLKILADEDPTEDEIAEIQELIAFCYVALDQQDLGVRAFREVLARKPSTSYDAAAVSPKIRAALDEARKPERLQ